MLDDFTQRPSTEPLAEEPLSSALDILTHPSPRMHDFSEPSGQLTANHLTGDPTLDTQNDQLADPQTEKDPTLDPLSLFNLLFQCSHLLEYTPFDHLTAELTVDTLTLLLAFNNFIAAISQNAWLFREPSVQTQSSVSY